MNLPCGDGSWSDGNIITQRFHWNSAEADENHRPHLRITLAAHDELNPTNHLLDEHAVDGCTWTLATDSVHETVKRRSGCTSVQYVQRHAVQLCLVRNVG